MAQSKEKLPLEEGECELYIHNACYCEGRSAPYIKVDLALTPRGKRVTNLFLSLTYYARVWAVQLAEYCIDYDLPWPEFADTKLATPLTPLPNSPTLLGSNPGASTAPKSLIVSPVLEMVLIFSLLS